MIIKNGKVRCNVYLDEKLYQRMFEDAKRLGIGPSAYVSVAVSEYLKQNTVTDLADLLRQLQQGQNPAAE